VLSFCLHTVRELFPVLNRVRLLWHSLHWSRHSWPALAAALAASLPASGGTYGPQSFTYADGISSFGDGTVIATSGAATVASVQGGALRLTQNGVSNTISSFKLSNLDVGKEIEAFDVTFTVQMAATGTPAEGWSVNFGAIPSGNGAGDGGFVMPKGIVIAWDTFNTGNDPPSIEVFCNGVSVANFPQTFAFGAFRPVAIHWDGDGLDISYDGVEICKNAPTPGFLPKLVNAIPLLQRIPARILGLGVRREHIRSPKA